MKKIICVDFDGVLHSYLSGWKGASVVTDGPVSGAMRWLREVTESGDYEVCIYSSRSSQEGGVEAMQNWLRYHLRDAYPQDAADEIIDALSFPTEKPPAHLTIDDRAICFRGTFPSLLEMNTFKPWNK